jgi:hypothetical protein
MRSLIGVNRGRCCQNRRHPRQILRPDLAVLGADVRAALVRPSVGLRCSK